MKQFFKMLVLAAVLFQGCSTKTNTAHQPVATEYAFFLFDNGEKNMIASMLNYADQHDKIHLDALDFRIIFMGAAIDAMKQEPFCHHPDKLIHYKDLGITETVDNTWPRRQKLSEQSVNNALQNLHVGKKVILPVSCSIYEQLLERYQAQPGIESLALRDNPLPAGDTDYFVVADQLQQAAKIIAVPSHFAAKADSLKNKNVHVVGHGPTEEWLKAVKAVDKEALRKRLGLTNETPVILYIGVYGEYFENCFKQFLGMLAAPAFTKLHAQVLIAPHPRYKGEIEKKLCAAAGYPATIIGGWEQPPCNVNTMQALAIADVVITADATSTVVVQANALGKKVVHINPSISPVSSQLYAQNILERVQTAMDLAYVIKHAQSGAGNHQDIFQLLGMPRDGGRLLWEEVMGK